MAESMSRIFAVSLLLLVPSLALAQTPCASPCVVEAGTVVSVQFDDTTGFAYQGYRLYLNDVRVGADLPPSALVGGTVRVVLPAQVAGTYSLVAASFTSTTEYRSAPYLFTVETSPPPPPPPPQGTTAGGTTIGPETDTNASGFLNGSRVILTGALAITSMSVHVGAVDALASNRLYGLAIYTDVSGQPGTLVASSTAGTLIANSWNTRPLVVVLPAGAYWLMYATNGLTAEVNNAHCGPGVLGQSAWSTPVPFGSWPTAYGVDTISNSVYSLYVAADAAPLIRLTPTNVKIVK
jgi:hypothetical protein